MLTVLRYGPPLALGVGGAGLIAAHEAHGLAWLMLVLALALLGLALTAPRGADREATDAPVDGSPPAEAANPMPSAPIVVYSASAARERVSATQADLVVLRCSDGTWAVSKDRDGGALSPRPWDELPARLKDAIGSVLL